MHVPASGAVRDPGGVWSLPTPNPGPRPSTARPFSKNSPIPTAYLPPTYRCVVSLPDGGAEALALWIVFTYALDAFDVAPILALCSPLKRCGKTTTEDLTAALAQRPLTAASITVAALYRTVEQFAPTLIVDEADTFLLTNLALRGVINSGHTRATAFVIRTAGHEPRLFSTWGARMIALIGRLPATLEDRAIVLPMRRRAPGEAVDRIRRTELQRQLDPLRRRAVRWVADHLAALRTADPAVPDELDDRQADNWRPLLAIAEAAGGVWPNLARAAARTLAASVVEADQAAPVQLLADLRDLFATTPADKLATAVILRYLATLEDRPWADYARGESLTPHQLARLLDRFNIKTRQIREGSVTRKGYMRSNFTDAFRRYLPTETLKHRHGHPAVSPRSPKPSRLQGHCR